MIRILDESKENKYSAIAFLQNLECPLEDLTLVEKELSKLDVKNGKILIDTILCRGNGSDRFKECLLVDGYLVKSYIKNVRISKRNPLRRISAEWIRS